MLSSFITEFRQQYPKGSITSDLLTVHDGLFIIRVAVSSDGCLLAHGLAANQTLEVAEDTACQRALERLGLTISQAAPPQQKPTTPVKPSIEVGPQPQASILPNPFEVVPIRSETPADEDTKESPAAPPIPAPQKTIAQSDKLPAETRHATPALPNLTVPQGDSPLSMSLATPPAPKPAASTSAPQPELDHQHQQTGVDPMGSPTAAPIDLSDIIAQTDVELQRLGWDVNKGREFLEKTYGKRSRHDLTDDELLEFLLYLETQSPEQA